MVIKHTVFALDCSESMLQRDYFPSRLGGAALVTRTLHQDLLQKSHTESIGVVAFGSEAEVVCPLTSPNKCEDLREAVESLSGMGKTNLSLGLMLAAKLLEQSGINSHAQILLLSDGWHDEGRLDPVDASNKIAAMGITIGCIGIAGDPGSVDVNRLQKIASPTKTGRRYCFIKNAFAMGALERSSVIATDGILTAGIFSEGYRRIQ
ncbi:vWA domain-containing protein [Cerasicoccus maritimus]|uniref:vWA domain-containing protein n=1 Tax=Cerasicoccus maritimus TaxID=490089 RepID=UPI0028525EF2|nr:VWA domain-containing protein [Cerasicoccus maritimus]